MDTEPPPFRTRNKSNIIHKPDSQSEHPREAQMGAWSVYLKNSSNEITIASISSWESELGAKDHG